MWGLVRSYVTLAIVVAAKILPRRVAGEMHSTCIPIEVVSRNACNITFIVRNAQTTVILHVWEQVRSCVFVSIKIHSCIGKSYTRHVAAYPVCTFTIRNIKDYFWISSIPRFET
jgi:hypothetical protein